METSLVLFYFIALFGLLSLGALIFFIIRAGIHRFWPSTSHPTIVSVMLSMVATPLLCILGFYLFLVIYFYYPHRDFNQDTWAAKQDKRYEMVDDLQSSHQLIGLTEKQVTTLLGKPDMRFENSWEYYLGMPPKLIPIDGDALSLEFRDGRVTRYWVHET
ncbi:hypothetical protein F1C16_01415 [Hymenobacter sp. NBH84]|uniref:hypothetical protein n=1 Tax=Hymenobacter sp. NBH84 TaxID=2596915 RepID=UPI0016263BD5|nr:hypothetical protein [Hymenobacter sp. NBH84]QNE38309.1 hypothetical protein F1C16_01415 [Hymenobacter sp. NBH84]